MIKPFNPACSDRALLYAAAHTIEVNARELKAAHCLSGRWSFWIDADKLAKALYNNEMHLVRELRARARMADTERVP